MNDAPITATKPLYLKFAQIYLAIAFPMLVVLLTIRLVMTPLFLQIEYTRPGFPEDYFGFTQQDRLNYAPYALNYLLNAEGIEYLGDLTFEDGTRMYNDRELRHMYDVKIVVQITFLVTTILSVLTAGLIFLLARKKHHQVIKRGFRNGAIFSLAVIIAIIIVAVFNWDFFFTTFHTIFFESGTWVFFYSDTLIRLFPEQFWFDAAMTIGGTTILAALIALFLTRQRA